jgi:hypothetical protein
MNAWFELHWRKRGLLGYTAFRLPARLTQFDGQINKVRAT